MVRIVQPRGAKGPDGKYPRGHVAALKERLGGAGAVQFLRIVPDSPLVYVHFESAAGAARALSAGGVGQLSLLAGDEEASYWQERQLEQQQRSKRQKTYDPNLPLGEHQYRCPRCHFRNFYPPETRACNKLTCGEGTGGHGCGLKFCVVCNKPASASCRCISAAWAR